MQTLLFLNVTVCYFQWKAFVFSKSWVIVWSLKWQRFKSNDPRTEVGIYGHINSQFSIWPEQQTLMFATETLKMLLRPFFGFRLVQLLGQFAIFFNFKFIYGGLTIINSLPTPKAAVVCAKWWPSFCGFSTSFWSNFAGVNEWWGRKKYLIPNLSWAYFTVIVASRSRLKHELNV